ncbi:MAG: TetR/AcrR family transcriptional regulator [Gammaproteobacteria bacterium]
MPGTSSASTRTREALILAGEQLFGEQGIDGVSLRQINTAAGQRNSSAAHYHFGSKDALVGAVVEYRMEHVNDRRLAMLANLEAAGRTGDIRAIVETVIYPIMDEIRDSEAGSHYIRFMAQVVGHPQISLTEIWNSPFGTGLARVIEHLRTALPELPPTILGQRFGLMWEQTIHALADRERLSSDKQGSRLVGRDVFASNLVDTVAGGLSAPISEATLAALEQANKPSNTTRQGD